MKIKLNRRDFKGQTLSTVKKFRLIIEMVYIVPVISGLEVLYSLYACQNFIVSNTVSHGQLLHTLTKKYLSVNTTKTSRTENTNLRVSQNEPHEYSG